MVADDDDDFDTFPCYRHPSEQTALRCLECDRPICVDCSTHGAVGIKCPECARTSRAARGVVPAQRLARGLVAGSLVAIALGSILAVVQVQFFGIILAYVVGLLVGAATRRASGGYRDPVLARGAAIAAGVGVGALPVLSALAAGSFGAYLFWAVIGAAAAAYAAYNSAS